MYKIVNGVEVALTQVEIDARVAEEAVVAAEKATYEATVAYKDRRKAEYPPEGDLIVAIWESLVEGDSTSLDLLQAQRLAVKTKYPSSGA